MLTWIRIRLYESMSARRTGACVAVSASSRRSQYWITVRSVHPWRVTPRSRRQALPGIHDKWPARGNRFVQRHAADQESAHSFFVCFQGNGTCLVAAIEPAHLSSCKFGVCTADDGDPLLNHDKGVEPRRKFLLDDRSLLSPYLDQGDLRIVLRSGNRPSRAAREDPDFRAVRATDRRLLRVDLLVARRTSLLSRGRFTHSWRRCTGLSPAGRSLWTRPRPAVSQRAPPGPMAPELP